MLPYVNIITSDRGWILERLASQICERLPYAHYGEKADPRALINYYITYSCWQKKISPIQMGLFTHLEMDKKTRQRFFDVAQNMSMCICMSGLYENMLREHKITNVITINPGMDLSLFSPKLQIGVVGRTYHTGRKGEALLLELQDIDWIDWHFTGEGWPGRALNLADKEMPDFYRKMDYILVPALYEGGPMCVVEALACGTKVIAPPIGWVTDFPHIEYRTGDAVDLRRVLTVLYEEKKKLATNVAHITWDAWARGHDWVFRMLAADQGAYFPRDAAHVLPSRKRIVLALHGDEKVSKGGPSTRVPVMADMLLNSDEYEPVIRRNGNIWPDKANLAHVFNIWKMSSCSMCVLSAARAGQPVVLSPIFLDLSEQFFFDKIQKIFAFNLGEQDLHERLRKLLQSRKHELTHGARYQEVFPGQFDEIREILERTNHVIFLSEHEQKLFESLDLPFTKSTVVRNPVDSMRYANATPDEFRAKYGISDYVLCVGRLEPRKNQLLLAYALRNEDFPLVFIGHGVEGAYQDLVHKYAPKNTLFIDRLPPGSDLIASAYAGAQVFCLPSWSEGASLSALEAAAAGCSMVLSDRSSEQEYFGNFARYCDPADPDSIRKAVAEAYNNPFDEEKKTALKNFVAEEYSWKKHVEKTEAVYKNTLETFASRSHVDNGEEPPTLYIDLSTSAHHNGPPMGMARVEWFYASKLLELYPAKVRFTLWNKPLDCFVPVKTWQFLDGSYKNLALIQDWPDGSIEASYRDDFFEAGSSFITMGGVWTFTPLYLKSLRNLVRDKRLLLTAFVHDLVPVKFACWYPRKDRAIFIDNTCILLSIAARIFTDSRNTAVDLQDFCAERNISCPPLEIARFGDNIMASACAGEPNVQLLMESVAGKPFVLFVSDLNIRKNHAMLLAIWRKLVQEHGKNNVPHLVCVGKRGLQSEIFVALADREELLDGILHIMGDVEDATLDLLYRKCLFTVYPSQYEGWGLPVAESLSYGKVCIASNSASIPEIAPGFVDLVEPNDMPAWHAKIASYIANPSLRAAREKQIKSYKIVTWDESAARILHQMEQPVLNPIKWPVCPLDTKINIVTDTKFLGSGWCAPETAGVWSSGSRAVILARLWLHQKNAVFHIRCCAYLPKGVKSLQVDVLIKGEPIGTFSVGQSMNSHKLELADALEPKVGFTDLKIDLRIRDPHRPSDYDNSNDDRWLGIFVEQLWFESIEKPLTFYAETIEKLEQMTGIEAADLEFFLRKRKDLRQLVNSDPENGYLKIFFWIWQYGMAEEVLLKRARKQIMRMLSEMAGRVPPAAQVDGYNELIDNIWRIRPDLHIFDITQQQGQQDLMQWFTQYGCREYNFGNMAGCNAQK